MLNIKAIEEKSTAFRNQLGGNIFAFPIDELEPFSKYAVTVFTGEGFYVFPDPLSISDAAAAVKATLEGFASEGWDPDYERNVRFISHDAQMNALDVTMRRLRKDQSTHRTNAPLFQQGTDVTPKEGEEGYLVSARGILKFSCLEMFDKNPKGIKFMDEYYKLLAMRKYGKTAAAIKQEVRRMGSHEAVKWIERTYARYVNDDSEVMNIMRNLS